MVVGFGQALVDANRAVVLSIFSRRCWCNQAKSFFSNLAWLRSMQQETAMKVKHISSAKKEL